MKETTNRLEELLGEGIEYLSTHSESEISQKSSPNKWSKKEILGHLVDSGINNLQRFTEIQFSDKPYKIRNYQQDDCVIANDYQNAELKEILNLWVSLNVRILLVVRRLPEASLDFEIVLDDGETSDLRFLIKDYVDHLQHHLNQIKKENL